MATDRDARETPLPERERLLQEATHDAKQAVERMEEGDWLRADQLLDAGVVP
jgi:hypothetical protein